MRLLVLHNIVLLLGWSVAANGLTIPSLDMEGLARSDESLRIRSYVGHLDIHSLRKGSNSSPSNYITTPKLNKRKGHGTPKKSRKAKPSEKKSKKVKKTEKTKKSKKFKETKHTKKQKKQKKSKSKHGKTTKPKPKTTQPSSVKPLPFTLPPRPTKAANVCLLDGVNCLSNSDEANLNLRRSIGAAGLEKRARELAAIPLKSGDLELTTKNYYVSGDLAKGEAGPKWKELWVDFSSDDVKSTAVKVFTNKPPQTPNNEHSYITEHILELQTIPRFIQAATQTTTKKLLHPIKLSKVVDDSWFHEWWNKDVKTEIDSRQPTFKDYENSKQSKMQDRSINDVIFEALGSTRNVKDFVLCEKGINGFKANLWADTAPSAEDKWMSTTRMSATGELPSNEHLSGLRTVLAVYNYMELPEVTEKLRTSIANVKTELGNIKHLTSNNLPKDAQKMDVDLAELWIEFMDKHLEAFHAKGVGWLKKMIDFAETKYAAELKRLEGWERTMINKKDVATKRNAAIVARDQLVKDLPAKELNIKKAVKAMEAEEKRVDAIADPKQQEDEKTLVGGPYIKTKKALTAANTALKAHQKKVGRATRKILEFDDKNLKKEIANIKEIEALLKKFEAESKKIKVLKAE